MSAGRKRYPRIRRHMVVHPLISASIARDAKSQRAAEIARPMRELFRQLATGEVCEVHGKAVMSMPDLDRSVRQSHTEWVEIAPAIEGWIDCWTRIAPKLRQDKLRYLADRLNRGEMVTPRMVEQASEQFEAAVAMIPGLPDGVIKSAVLTTQIGWEIEKMRDTDEPRLA